MIQGYDSIQYNEMAFLATIGFMKRLETTWFLLERTVSGYHTPFLDAHLTFFSWVFQRRYVHV